MQKIFQHVPHPHIERRNAQHPPTVADQHPRGGPVTRFNTFLALKITSIVGTMWCAYAFALLALVSLPAAIHSRDPIIIVAWVAQTFLQLVLLPSYSDPTLPLHPKLVPAVASFLKQSLGGK